MKNALKKSLLWLNLVLAFIMLVGYLSPFVHPGTFSLPSIIGLFYPFLFIINIVFVLLWLSFRKSYFLISLLTLLVGFKMSSRFVQFTVDRPAMETVESSISIMSYNLRHLFEVPPVGRSGTEKKVQAVSGKIKELAPELDFICVQEGIEIDKIGAKLGLPHHIRASHALIWLLSAHPIVEHGELSLPDQIANFAIWADVKVDGQLVRVYSVHLHSNKITAETEHLLEDGRIQERETWISMGDILNKYRGAATFRAEQAKLLEAHAHLSKYPVLLAGDFNDTPQSYSYQTLQRNLKDSFIMRGKGIGTTYAGSLPALRIDNILADNHFETLSHEVFEIDYSDHFPIVARYSLKGE